MSPGTSLNGILLLTVNVHTCTCERQGQGVNEICSAMLRGIVSVESEADSPHTKTRLCVTTYASAEERGNEND